MANGELARRTTAAQAPARPARRLPATQAKGSAMTETTPEKARTATSPLPKARIQKWRST